MRKSAVFQIKGLLFVFAVLSPFRVSYAVLEEFSPYAFTRVLYDSNVFRVSGDQAAIALLGDDNRDDTIGYLGAGLKSDLKLSRQHLFLDGEVARVKYDTFSDLDHTRINGRAAWGWRVGNLWSGGLGYLYRRELSSFNQLRLPEKDMKTTQTGYLDVGYQIHPDWELLAASNYVDTSYQDRDRLDRKAASAQLEVLYQNTLNSRVGMRAKYTDFDLKDEQISGVQIDNDYQVTEISGVLYWEATGKSSLEARLGYTDLQYEESGGRDFQGTSGQLTYFLEISPKTKIDAVIWRETSSLGDEISSYVLTQGVRIQPRWSATPKITLQGEVAYTNDDYKGEEDIRSALGLQRRDDDTWLYGVSAQWQPRNFLRLTLGYRKETRDSSTDANDFDDKQINANVRVTF